MYYTAKVRLFGDNQSKSGQKSVVCRNRAITIAFNSFVFIYLVLIINSVISLIITSNLLN